MSGDDGRPPRPSRLRRWLFRFPIRLYQLRLGWLLGGRFLLLTHTGRRSGRPRQTVLEVVDRRDDGPTYLIASAWGDRADWFRNIVKSPAVTIQVGCRRLAATATPLAPEASGRALVDYARRHPRAARAILRVIGYNVDTTPETLQRLGETQIRMVELRVVGAGQPASRAPA